MLNSIRRKSTVVLLFIFSAVALKGQGLDTMKIDHLIDSSRKHVNTNPEISEALLAKSLTLSKEYFYTSGLIKTYINLGILKYYQGDFSAALEFYHFADSILNEKIDSSLKASLYSNRAIVYTMMEDYNRAMDDYLVAIDINESRNNLDGLGNNYINVGGIYFKSKKFNEALVYFNKALKIKETSKDSIGIATLLGNIGGIHIYNKEFNIADSIFHETIRIYKKLNDQRGLLMANSYLGVLYEQQRDFEKARKQYLICLELAEKMNVAGQIVSNTQNMASSYFKEKNFKAAEEWFLKENSLVLGYEDSIGMRRSYRNLAEVYRNLGDYKKVVDNMFKYDELNNLLNQKEKDQLLKNLEYKTELYEKEKSLTILEKTNLVQRLELERKNLLIYGLSGLGVLFILLLVVFIKFRSQKLKANNAMLQNQLLRSQINPHFIFNAFNSIQAYFINKEYESGQLYLRNFAFLIRSFLEKTEKDFSTIDEEIKMMKKYLDIEKMRLDDKFDYMINVDSGIEVNELMIPSFVVQTYLENAVIHGVSEIDEKGKITIDLKQAGGGLKLTVKDNGVGINTSRMNKLKSDKLHESKGMKITLDRISHLKRKARKKIQIEIIDLSERSENERGTLVEFSFPKLYLS